MSKKITSFVAGTVLLLGLGTTAHTMFSSSSVEATPVKRVSGAEVVEQAPVIPPGGGPVKPPGGPIKPPAMAPIKPPIAGGCMVGARCNTVGQTCATVGGIFSRGVTGPDGIYYPNGYCIQCAGQFAPGQGLTYQVFSGPTC